MLVKKSFRQIISISIIICLFTICNYVPAQAAVTVTDGVYFIKNVQTGKYLDMANPAATPGASSINVIVYTFGGSSNQQWKIVRQSDGTYSIRSMYNLNYTLDVYQWNNQDGTNVQAYNSTSTSYKWKLTQNSDGTFCIMPSYSTTRGLDVYYGSDPSQYAKNVQLYTYANGNNQKWVLEKVDAISLHTDYSGSISAGQVRHYSFAIPGNGGLITAETKGTTDTFGTVSMNGIQYSNDDDGIGTNFAIGFKMNSGQTAIISVRHFSSSGTGNYTLNVRRQRAYIHTFWYGLLDINTHGDATTPSSKLSSMGYLTSSRQQQSVSDVNFVDHTGYTRINSEVYFFSGHGQAGGVHFYEGTLWSRHIPSMNNCKLAVWSSCYSSTASSTEVAINQAAIDKGARSSIGWPDSVSDLSAPTFTDQLFTSLAEGKTVAQAAAAASDKILFPWDNVKDYNIKGNTSTTLSSATVQPKSLSVGGISRTELNADLSKFTYVEYPLKEGGTRYIKTINGCLTNDYYDVYSNGQILKSEQTITRAEINQAKNISVLKTDYRVPQTMKADSTLFNKLLKAENHTVYIKMDNETIPVRIIYADYKNDEGFAYQDVTCINLNDNSLINYSDICVAK